MDNNKIKDKIGQKTRYTNHILLVVSLVVIIGDRILSLANFLTRLRRLRKKEEYHNHLSMKLNNSQTSAKTYYKLVSNFKEKANLFNKYFASQCNAITNSSVLRTTIPRKTRPRLTSIDFEDNDVIKTIRSLNVNKT